MLRSLWKCFFLLYTLQAPTCCKKSKIHFFIVLPANRIMAVPSLIKCTPIMLFVLFPGYRGHRGPFLLPRRFGFSEMRPLVPRDRSNNLGFLLICCRSCVLLKNYDCDTYSKPLMNSTCAQGKRWFQFLTCSHEFGWMDSEWQLRCDRPEPSCSASL